MVEVSVGFNVNDCLFRPNMMTIAMLVVISDDRGVHAWRLSLGPEWVFYCNYLQL